MSSMPSNKASRILLSSLPILWLGLVSCTQATMPPQSTSCGPNLTPLEINETTTVCVLAADSTGEAGQNPSPAVFTTDQCPKGLGTIDPDTQTCSFEGGFKGMKQSPTAGSTYFTSLPYGSGACFLDVTQDYLKNLLGVETCQDNSTNGCAGLAAVNPVLFGYTVLAPEAVGLGIQSIRVTAGGSGYEQAPTVELLRTTDVGSGAQAQAVVQGGKVTEVKILDPGKNYLLPPIVRFQSVDGGSGAEAEAQTKSLGGWGCTDSGVPHGGSIAPYRPSGVAYKITGPTGNEAVVAVVDRCGGTVQFSSNGPVHENPSSCAGFQNQLNGEDCAFSDGPNNSCGCGDSNLSFQHPEDWSLLTPWAPGFGTAPPLYPNPTSKCDSNQCVDWCAGNNHPHFDLDQKTFAFLCPGGDGSCTLSKVEPFVVPSLNPEESGGPLVECDVDAGVQQCCSARGCTGKVLSNRDAHNCKVKSRGKSWHDAAGACVNL